MIDKVWQLLDYTINTAYHKNIPVIWSYQNVSRIKKPYIVIDYTTDMLSGHEWYDPYVDANGMRKVCSWRRATIDVQVYNERESISIASFIASALTTEVSLAKQVELDCSIGNRLMLQRVPALLNESQFEDRAIYQFEFFYTETLLDDVGFFDTIVVEGGYVGGATDIPFPPITPGVPNPDSPITCTETITVPYSDIFPPEIIWDNETTTWDDDGTVWYDKSN